MAIKDTHGDGGITPRRDLRLFCSPSGPWRRIFAAQTGVIGGLPTPGHACEYAIELLAIRRTLNDSACHTNARLSRMVRESVLQVRASEVCTGYGDPE